VLVVHWLDRLGRNYADVVDTIREFMRRGAVVRTVINNIAFDGATTDPMQCAVRDAQIAFMAATAQAQAEATKAAQRAGIEHAKPQPQLIGRHRGRGSAIGPQLELFADAVFSFAARAIELFVERAGVVGGAAQ
jgi:putative DNA-invertase from lambdoid prophage Rac